jgi:hypothetical protein
MIAIFFMNLSCVIRAPAGGVDAQESEAIALSARCGCLSAFCQDEARAEPVCCRLTHQMPALIVILNDFAFPGLRADDLGLHMIEVNDERA